MRPTQAHLQALQANSEYQELWRLALPWTRFAVSSLTRTPDADTMQEAHLATGVALRRWDAAKGALSTFLYHSVRGALLNHFNAKGNGGIGSRWLAAEKRAVELTILAPTLSTANKDEDEPNKDDNGSAELTYNGTSNVPEGFGDAGVEIGRAVASYAWTRQDSTRTRGSRRWAEERARKRAAQPVQSKTCYKDDTGNVIGGPRGRAPHRTNRPAWRYPGFWNGAVSVMGDVSAWRESTGKVWQDWAWKPGEGAIKEIKRGDRKWYAHCKREDHVNRAIGYVWETDCEFDFDPGFPDNEWTDDDARPEEFE